MGMQPVCTEEKLEDFVDDFEMLEQRRAVIAAYMCIRVEDVPDCAARNLGYDPLRV